MKPPRDTDTFDLSALDGTTAPGTTAPGSTAPGTTAPGTTPPDAATLTVAPSDATAPGEAAPDDGRYAPVGVELGRGGLGRVSLVVDRRLGREVARKVPAGGGAEALRAEARVTARLEHPSIVPVYDAGEGPDGVPWYVMKVVRGRTLAEMIGGRTPAARRALLPHVLDVCQAVAYAHARGVLHRDLKPPNVMIGEFGETVVLDWGLGQGDAARVSGTPGYLAPEQAAGIGEQVSERTDVWGLGAVLYAVLTGVAPIPGDRDGALAAVLRGPPVPARTLCADTPPELDAIAARALAFDPADRYPSAAAMAADLTAFMAGERVEAYTYTLGAHVRRLVARNPLAVAVGGAALVVLAVAGAGATWRVVQERDRAVEAERARTLEVASGLGREARDALAIGDPQRAREAALAALAIQEDVGTRGLLVAAESAWLPGPPAVSPTSTDLCGAVAYGPTGELAVACDGGLWLDDGTPRALLSGEGSFGSVAWSGDVLVAGDRRGAVWTWAGGEPEELGEGPRPLFVAEGPPGGLAVLSPTAGAERWTLGGERAPLWPPDTPFGRPAFLPAAAGLPAAYAVVDGAGLEVRDALTGATLQRIAAPDVDGQFVAVSPDRRWAASAGHPTGGSRRVYLWSLADGRVEPLAEHGGAVAGVAFSPDGRWLAARCAGEGVRVWEVETRAFLGLLPAPAGKPGGVAFSPDGGTIASSAAGSILRWPLDPAPHASRWHVSTVRVEGLASDDQGVIAVDRRGRVLRLDDEGRATPVGEAEGEARFVGAGPGGLLVLGDPGASGVWAEGGRVALGDAGTLYSGAWLSPGELVVAADGRALRVWSGRTGEPVGEPCLPDTSVHEVTARGDLVAAGTPTGLVALRPEGCEVVGTAPLDGPPGPPAIAPDGRFVAAAVRAGHVGVWRWPDLAGVQELATGVRVPERVAWSADGARLAVSGIDGELEVWDTATWAPLARWSAHDGGIRALLFHDDHLYSAGADGTIGAWTLAALSPAAPPLAPALPPGAR